MAGSTAARRHGVLCASPATARASRLRPGVLAVRRSASLQPAAAPQITLRARLRVLSWIHRQIDATRKFSRRRRTYALGQHSPQQAQTRMSRSAPLGVNKRALRVLRHHPARLRSAETHDKAPILTLKPVRCGFSTDGDMIGASDCCGSGEIGGHAQASPREMVLAAPPRPSPAPERNRDPQPEPKNSRCAFLYF